MLPKITAGSIYSTLGNNSSLVPLAVKDVANSLGLTASSYVTGNKLESKDRFLDEFGTQSIWLFGLPVFKKITDLTLYKALKIDPKVDVRLLDTPELLDKAIELSPNVIKHGKDKQTDILKNGLKGMKNNPKFSRHLALSKFAAATVLTIVSYNVLTKYRHNQTKKAAEREILSEYGKKQKDIKNEFIDTYSFTKTSMVDFTANNTGQTKNLSDKPAFTGIGDFTAKSVTALKDFMNDPVRNLMIVDGTITTERLSFSRNTQEFVGYAIKEGAFWAFMYLASKPIQKWLENRSSIKHNKSIDLDARVIESEDLKNAFANKAAFEKQMADFPVGKSDVEIYEYLHKNPDNIVVKMAKKSDEIPTLATSDNWFNQLKKTLHLSYLEISDKNAIDTRRFIEIGNSEKKTGIRGIHTKLMTLYSQYLSSNETLDDFLKSVKKHKRSAVRMNLGSCVGALGIAVPLVMIAVRYIGGNKNFQVKEDLKKELIFK